MILLAKDSKKAAVSPIPQHEVDALARLLLPEIQKYFESEEGQREFDEWKARQSTKEEEKDKTP
ncbi:hypothetical protein LJC60_04365 [Ruminococcaceae bacterium OttesenSCG-928-D13]|nr:hypothetical protein [Ruminococcaceae bacterium OttesenSCG-928-D13]